MTMTAATEAATVAGAPRLWCSRSKASKRQIVRLSDWHPVSMLITCWQHVAKWLLQIDADRNFFVEHAHQKTSATNLHNTWSE